METTILNLTSGIDITIWGSTVLPLRGYYRKHMHPDKRACFLVAGLYRRSSFPPPLSAAMQWLEWQAVRDGRNLESAWLQDQLHARLCRK